MNAKLDPALREAVRREVTALTDQLVSIRREFHRHPEVAMQEEETSRRIRERLEALGIPYTVKARTGVVGRIHGSGDGPTVALRADIDALPIQEENEVDYKSRVDGVMHACGHDGHMAMLLGAAAVLNKLRGEFSGDIVLLFQPSEEKIPGGALPLIEEGALDGVDYVVGTHLWAALPVGQIGVVHGAAMAAADEFRIEVIGKGGHGSMPHQTVDALVVGCQVVDALQTVVSRSVDPLDPAVLSVGTFQAGTNFNIIAPRAVMTGTVRSLSQDVRELIKSRMARIVRAVCDAAGAEFRFDYKEGYPPLVNDDQVTDLVEELARGLVGEANVVELRPNMGGEDFAYYLQKVPGCFFFTGGGNPEKGIEFPHHHPRFDFDEDALPIGTRLLVESALALMRG